MTSAMMVALLFSLLGLATVVSAQTAQAQMYDPMAFTMKPAPQLMSALSPNYALYNSEKVHYGKGINGPTSFAFIGGDAYTVTSNGQVVNIATCPPKVVASLRPAGCTTYKTCGLLMAVRPDRQVAGALLVVDAYRGVWRVDPVSGLATQIYNSATPVAGRAPKFLNGLVQARDGTILMTDSSNKFEAAQDIYVVMEGKPSGRLLSLNPANGVATVVLNDIMVYPNGLELTKDEDAVLIAESGRARILRVGLTPAAWLAVSVFSDNLPALPTNIRRSDRNTYWVSTFIVRSAPGGNNFDKYAPAPNHLKRKQAMMKQTPAALRNIYGKYGLILELNSQGTPIGSLHDPTGRMTPSVSEAQEFEGILYYGHPTLPYVGRIVLPQGDGRTVSVEGVLQVLRSRCQVPENRLAQAKQVLTQYINRQQQGAQAAAQPAAPAIQPITLPVAPPTPTAPAAGGLGSLWGQLSGGSQPAAPAAGTAPAAPALPAAPAPAAGGVAPAPALPASPGGTLSPADQQFQILQKLQEEQRKRLKELEAEHQRQVQQAKIAELQRQQQEQLIRQQAAQAEELARQQVIRQQQAEAEKREAERRERERQERIKAENAAAVAALLRQQQQAAEALRINQEKAQLALMKDQMGGAAKPAA